MSTIGNKEWLLQDNVGRLVGGRLSGDVDPTRPFLGLRVPRIDGDQSVSNLLTVFRSGGALITDDRSGGQGSELWPLPLLDTYVRGSDLVASYLAVDDWPYSPQLYWRAGALDGIDGILASLSLLVSVQTHLLDTSPRMSVSSQVPNSELLVLSINETGEVSQATCYGTERSPPVGMATCVLCRPKNSSLTYTEIMPASDYSGLQIRGPYADGRFCSEWQLFSDFLEKGVIRRARVHGALLPREKDVDLAVNCCRAIERLELPLTT